MKIVYLNPTGQLGGAEVSLLDILASLRAAEREWSLRLIVGSNGPLVARAEALGVATKVVALPPALARLGEGHFPSGLLPWGCRQLFCRFRRPSHGWAILGQEALLPCSCGD